MRTLRRSVCSDYFAANVEPALRVKKGESFCLELASFLTVYPDGKLPTDAGKLTIPIHGPVYVEGAIAGAVLKVYIEHIELSGQGVIMALPGKGPLGENITKCIYKVVSYDEHVVYFDSRIKIPVKKMIGKIGTAPLGTPPHSSIPGPHGGNMDNKHITEGCYVYLPIYVDGAFLYTGDLHAAQGDGEMVTGVESEGSVILWCDVQKDLSLSYPVIVTQEAIVCTGAAETLQEAARVAARNSVNLLMAEWGLSFSEAYMLCGVASDLCIAQMINPLVGIKIVTPLSVLTESSRWKCT